VPVLAGQFGDLPGGKAFGMTAEPLRTDFRRQHALGGFEKIAPRMIEIVRMLVVAEQHGIDLADIIGAERRANQLFQLHMRQLISAGLIEGRIGEQPEAVDFDQRGGAADQGDGNCHDLLLYEI
jgi:hypothetical protein